ncbi:ribonucleotide reductase small subunit [Plasmodium cynomolgi strain B]|uniref:Ribonucleotide reductase small subunit n=1 Tax=Plasmodium cynomolgi (strain B) TaxID=1120755 RepID=K6UV30_PLACD|nr:ribonucleotide reductase small subunit [Plasmodium cynomolgi strain B]GAB66095.1 ribonucleotide reductase small subunit [Plasmodium cynomolgi strain B]
MQNVSGNVLKGRITIWRNNYYKEIESLFWTAEDYNFDKDKKFLESIDKSMLVKLFELICFYSLK